jgi:phage terminase small subunit
MPRKRPGVNLTDKQRAFCHEYVTDLNATNAAIRAGYSEDSARSTASHLLDDVEVKAFVRKLQEDKFLSLRINAEDVMKELARIGFADIEDFAEEGELPEQETEERTAVPLVSENGEEAPPAPKPRAALSYRKVMVNKTTGAKTTVTFSLYHKIMALRIIGLHLGLWDKDKRKRGDRDKLVVIMPKRVLQDRQNDGGIK